MANPWDKLLSIAEAEVGYLEKVSNSNLDSKTANAGYNNYTKYARDLAKTNWYNGSKQGYAWCTTFADWCFIQAYGYDMALKLQGFPERSLAAVVPYAANYYKAKGRLYTTPQVGDRVFFGDAHTGIVVAVNGSKFTTIEGNTSGASGVISNGGGVCKKQYVNYSTYRFGRPDWSLIKESVPVTKNVNVSYPQLQKGQKNIPAIKTLQIILNGLGYNCGTPDMDFGAQTDAAVRAYQKAHGLVVDGVVGHDTWQSFA